MEKKQEKHNLTNHKHDQKTSLQSWSISIRANSLEEEYNGEEVVRKQDEGRRKDQTL